MALSKEFHASRENAYVKSLSIVNRFVNAL